MEEINVPVAKISTLRSMLVTSCSQGYNIQQMDAQMAFLNREVKSIYVEQPNGCIDEKNLIKFIIYGLRGSLRN